MQAYMQAQAHVSKHRCKADIIAIILEAAVTGGTTKAKIYYRSFMTYQRLKGYLLAFRREWINRILERRAFV